MTKFVKVPSVTLNTGGHMPAIGLGCWSGLTDEEHESARPWIITALKNGFRHLDTAHGYGTEGAVGKAIRDSGIPREEIWVTTKLPPNHHAKVAASLDESLSRLGFGYFDLYLMHWPMTHVDFEKEEDGRLPGPNGEPGEGAFKTLEHPTFNEVWAEMEKLLETGKVKNIGVSNFSVKNLTKLLETAKVIPAVNQVEMHPHLTQDELLAFTKEKGIILTAYSPTGYAPIRNDPTIIKLAEKYGVSPAQISLAWHVARGTTAVPKSTNSDRQKGSLTALPELDPEDVKLLTSLNKNTHLCNYPGPKGNVFGWTYEQMGW